MGFESYQIGSLKVNVSIKWPLKETWEQTAWLSGQLAALVVGQYILYLNWLRAPFTQSQAVLLLTD